jgi:hypothetical protein
VQRRRPHRIRRPAAPPQTARLSVKISGNEKKQNLPSCDSSRVDFLLIDASAMVKDVINIYATAVFQLEAVFYVYLLRVKYV